MPSSIETRIVMRQQTAVLASIYRNALVDDVHYRDASGKLRTIKRVAMISTPDPRTLTSGRTIQLNPRAPATCQPVR
jgi:hypothetical protein